MPFGVDRSFRSLRDFSDRGDPLALDRHVGGELGWRPLPSTTIPFLMTIS
jgi:hypothetical protein